MNNLASNCRLSGESLADAETLFEIKECPLPGIYPLSIEESLPLRSSLRVIQARTSGFVQLAHTFDSSLYSEYSFSGGGSRSYRAHLENFAHDIARTFPKSASILEVGCGDGWLLKRLRELGFANAIGIDPGRAAQEQGEDHIIHGFFPQDLSTGHQAQKFDLIVSRHVLEHIESPRQFTASLATALADDGQLWLEVPDLQSTLDQNLWSNFYQLHCNYFCDITLDQMAATAGLRCISGSVVEVFGGSLLRKYIRASPPLLPSPAQLRNIGKRADQFREHLSRLAKQLPPNTVGYGAAERTAVTFGFSPELAASLAGLHDGNPLLVGRHLAGTNLRISSKEDLLKRQPNAVLIFAISNVAEIISEWHSVLPDDLVVGIVGGEFSLKTLKEYK